MRKLILLLAVVLFAGIANAQITNEEIALVKSILNSERKVFFAQNMDLTTVQSEIFWDIYEDYEKEKAPIGNLSIKLFKRLIKEEDTLDDKTLIELQKSSLKNQQRRLALKKKYFNIIRKKIDVDVAVRFTQIDEYVNTMVSASLLESMPLVKTQKK
ncbi:hypothetical protein DMA11_23585 [Marinilabiliaceae bacterium JC017]|nr:hypothetical protein DMA11_23585 [Marinilabiliaceae bacterium JC017]